MKLFRTDNELIVFLFNFFLLETIGGGLFLLFIRVIRFFGLPQLYYLYYSSENSRHWLFGILLLIAVAISLVRLQIKKQKIKKRSKD